MASTGFVSQAALQAQEEAAQARAETDAMRVTTEKITAEMERMRSLSRRAKARLKEEGKSLATSGATALLAGALGYANGRFGTGPVGEREWTVYGVPGDIGIACVGAAVQLLAKKDTGRRAGAVVFAASLSSLTNRWGQSLGAGTLPADAERLMQKFAPSSYVPQSLPLPRSGASSPYSMPGQTVSAPSRNP